MIIATFSQWRTISTFHLFICSNLASTIPVFAAQGIGLTDPRSNQSPLQRTYFAFYAMLRLGISAFLIYRFRFWGNTSGQCFVIPHALPHIGLRVPLILGTTLRIAWDLGYTVITLFWLIGKIRGSPTTPRTVQDWLQQKPASTRTMYIVIGSVINVSVPYVVPFIWNAYWTITIVLANQGHVLGDEYLFTFGQVGALVAFVASFYTIGSSYLSKRWAAS